MYILYFYIIGVVIAFIMATVLLFKEDKKSKEKLQYGMIGPIAILSWVSVYLLFFKLKNKYIK